MKFGVIIPCRNISEFFIEYISYNFKLIKDRDIPLVFIDNKSDDNSVELIKSLTNTLLQSEIDGGFAYSLNKGINFLIENFKSEAFLILSSDVKINNSLLDSIINLKWKNHWGYLSFTENNLKTTDNYEIEKNPSSASIFMIHTSTLERVGYYDEEYYMYGEDNDYFIRIKSKDLNFIKSPEIFFHKGQGYSKENIYSNYISSLCYRNYLLVYRKNNLYLKLIIAILKSIIFVILGDKIFLFLKPSNEVERFTNIKFRFRLLYFFRSIKYLLKRKGLILNKTV